MAEEEHTGLSDLDDQRSQQLLDELRRLGTSASYDVWRELVNGRWVVFLRYGEQTYCLLPLEFSTVSTVSTERAASD